MSYECFDVVIVPFPFTDKAQQKRRPALILSHARIFGKITGHSVMAMITSAKNPPWPLDVPITDSVLAGLPAPSVVRMKLHLRPPFYPRQTRDVGGCRQKTTSRSLVALLDISAKNQA